jgi:hypothetical protein
MGSSGPRPRPCSRAGWGSRGRGCSSRGARRGRKKPMLDNDTLLRLAATMITVTLAITIVQQFAKWLGLVLSP